MTRYRGIDIESADKIKEVEFEEDEILIEE